MINSMLSKFHKSDKKQSPLIQRKYTLVSSCGLNESILPVGAIDQHFPSRARFVSNTYYRLEKIRRTWAIIEVPDRLSVDSNRSCASAKKGKTGVPIGSLPILKRVLRSLLISASIPCVI